MPTKTWVVGEEVLAADFNAYVQKQVVATFANAAARAAAIPAPTAGMTTHLADTKKVETWDGTAWRPDWSSPWGRIGRASKTAADVGLGSSAITDYGGLSVAFTAVAGRIYRAWLQGRWSLSLTSNLLALTITDHTNTQFQEWACTQTSGMCNMAVDLTPGGGALTLKVRYQVLGGGSADSIAGANRPLTFTVDDVGPV